MEDQCYGLWGSGSTASAECATVAAGEAVEPADLWPLGSQIRQMLGEDCELEPAFFEEIWTSGQPAAVESRRRRRDRAVTADFEDCTFVQRGGPESLFFTQERKWAQDCRWYAGSAMPTASYAASWLREPPEVPEERIPDTTSSVESATSDDDGKRPGVPCSMQYQRACELLSVSGCSTEAQIKAAYRRMAGEWHPDRLERKCEELRAFATQQMTAINEAYCYLRSHPRIACY